MNPASNTALATGVRDSESPMPLGFAQESQRFDLMVRQAALISKSDMVPKEYRGNEANSFVALEIASRLNASPFMIMQSMDVIHGRPSWRASFLIAMVNASGRFSPLEFEMVPTGPEKTVPIVFWEKEGYGPNAKNVKREVKYTYIPTTCRAFATSNKTGKIIYGPPVSYDMAIEQGWVAKAGSKWLGEMRELMLNYRAGSFFARIHASDLTLGMQTAEEVYDAGPTIDVEVTPVNQGSRPAPTSKAENPYRDATPPKKAEETKAPAADSTDDAPPPPKPPRRSAAAAKKEEKPAETAAGDVIEASFGGIVDEKEGEKDGRTWKKVTIEFHAGGETRKAATFSESVQDAIRQLFDGDEITLVTESNANPKWPEKIVRFKGSDGEWIEGKGA